MPTQPSIEDLVIHNNRFPREAYVLVSEALNYTQEKLQRQKQHGFVSLPPNNFAFQDRFSPLLREELIHIRSKHAAAHPGRCKLYRFLGPA